MLAHVHHDAGWHHFVSIDDVGEMRGGNPEKYRGA